MPGYLRQLVEAKRVDLALEQLEFLRVAHPAQYALALLHVRKRVAEGRAYRDPWRVVERALRLPKARRTRAA
jgi:hypothetical protein